MLFTNLLILAATVFKIHSDYGVQVMGILNIVALRIVALTEKSYINLGTQN